MEEEFRQYLEKIESSESESKSLEEIYQEWFDRPEISCECGFKSREWPNSGLLNHEYFLPYSILLSENELDYLEALYV